jgi:peptidoglycan/LPS O-acetylase OafA/YrhL
MWVVFSHFGVPFLRDPRLGMYGPPIRAIFGAQFNGPAAVIIFFVISGFCIHCPNRKRIEFSSWKTYYARSYL